MVKDSMQLGSALVFLFGGPEDMAYAASQLRL